MPALLSSHEAMDRVSADLAALNHREVERVSNRARKLAESEKFYIYNVGPDLWQVPLGSLGVKTIAPCPEGKRHSDPLVIPGIVYEAVLTEDNGKMRQRQEDGYLVACDIVGIGSHKDPSCDLTRWGVFISEHNPPREEEIVAARAKLQQRYAELVQDADKWYQQGPQFQNEIGARHRMAARMLNIEREWSKGVAQMDRCPGCGEVVNPGLIMHGGKNGCGWIFDRERYDAAVAAGNIRPAVSESAPTPKPEPGKPLYQGKR